jgi:hypothetical protein
MKGGGDFPTRDPTTGRWTGVAPPEQPTERRALAACATITNHPPSPRPTTGPRRRLPGQTLPTIQEVRAYDGYQLESSVGSLARPPPPPPTRRPPLPPIGQSGPPLPPPARLAPPPPVGPPPRSPQQQQQQTPASATPGEEQCSDSSSDYGQGPLVQCNSTTNERRGPRRSGLRGIFSGFGFRRRGSRRLARPASRSASEDQIDM